MSAAKTPRTSEPQVVTGEKTIVTFRMPADLARWSKEQAEGLGTSFNEFAVSVLADLKGLYGLPAQMIDVLEADREAMNLGRREYLMHLLLTRYDQVKEREPGFGRRGQDRRKR